MVEQNNEIVIDIENCILGRVCSNISKKLLLNQKVILVNCNSVVILGRRSFLVKKYKDKLKNKVVKQGPYYSRNPCDMVKRSVRNMVPYKNLRGKEALKNLKCYNTIPKTLGDKKITKIDGSKLNDLTSLYYTKMVDLCRVLGYKN